jgi:hypothetical protein
MKKNLLFVFIAGLLFTASTNLKAQQLYSNFEPANFVGQLPASAFAAVLTSSIFDDVEIPDQPGDSINITQVKIAVYRDATAPAQSYVLYYALLNQNGTGPDVDTSYFTIPPTLVTTVSLTKNTTGAGAYIVEFGDSINTLFKIPSPTTEIISGQKTFFIGLKYGSAAKADTTNGWLICNPGSESDNISVAEAPASGGGGLWLYTPPSTKETIVLTQGTAYSPNTMAMQVYGAFTTSLPVSFLSFNGVLQNSIGVLNWSTSRETNNKGFEVEKSTDGQTYNDIGFVAGTGTTSNISNYTFSDPKMISGDNYYRLKQIDLDGNFNYSSVIKLEFSKLDWTIIGNPSNNSSVQLQLDKQHNIAVQVVSIAGNVIETINKGSLGQGTYSIPLDFSHAASGMYVVRMIIDGQSSSKNIMK